MMPIFLVSFFTSVVTFVIKLIKDLFFGTFAAFKAVFLYYKAYSWVKRLYAALSFVAILAIASALYAYFLDLFHVQDITTQFFIDYPSFNFFMNILNDAGFFLFMNIYFSFVLLAYFSRLFVRLFFHDGL